ncbi:MAG: hypothetical protein ACAH80_10580 [Alphaproteobacteria bacterium]
MSKATAKFWCMALAGILVLLAIAVQFFNNVSTSYSQLVQRYIERDLSSAMDCSEKLNCPHAIRLSAHKETGWDHICLTGFDQSGSSAADGLSIAKNMLKEINFSGFEVANKIYSDSEESRYGLIFISKEQKLVVVTAFKNRAFPAEKRCVQNQHEKTIGWPVLEFKGDCNKKCLVSLFEVAVIPARIDYSPKESKGTKGSE